MSLTQTTENQMQDYTADTRGAAYPYYHTETPASLFDLLWNSKCKFGSRTALIARHNNVETAVSYAQFASDVMAACHYIRKMEMTDKRIAIVGKNSYEWIVAFFAVICSGNIAIPLDANRNTDDLARSIQRFHCSLLLYSAEFSSLPDQAGCKTEPLKNMLCGERETDGLFSCRDINAPSMIVETSGTTGVNKGVVLSQKNICSSIIGSARSIDYSGRTIACLPFHHIFAIVSTVLAPLANGMEIYICSSVAEVFKVLPGYAPDFFCCVPAVIEGLYTKLWHSIRSAGGDAALSAMIENSEADRKKGIDNRAALFMKLRLPLGKNIKYIISGGAYLDRKYTEFFDAIGIPILIGYGITECASALAVNRYGYFRHGTLGMPLGNVTLKLADMDSDGIGEICARGDMVMLGYEEDEAETAQVLRDGWFHTGDLGSLDEDGFVHFHGRKKNLIILSNGENVSPEYLERKISGIEGVNEVLVYERNGSIAAEIYPTDSKRFDADYFHRMIAELNRSLPNHHKITVLGLRDTEFEKNSTKKIIRNRGCADRKDFFSEVSAPSRKAHNGETILPDDLKTIRDAFASVLDKNAYQIDDHFFLCGGDSLGVIELDVLLSEKYNIQPEDIFNNPTPRMLYNNVILHNDQVKHRKHSGINECIPLGRGTAVKMPKRILLTGANGFLGSHLCRELTASGYEITALVRDSARFDRAMQYYFPGEAFQNVSVLIGDITKPMFGLTPAQYGELLNKIDAVVHTAADVRHSVSYSISESINVNGTKNIIAFCLEADAALHHASTFSVAGFDTNTTLTEEVLDIQQSVWKNGYMKSKYIAEELVLEAKLKGLKANIYRLGNIAWRTDGKLQINAEENGLIARLKGFRKLQCYPEALSGMTFDFTYVDEAAKAYVLLLKSGRIGNIWHIINPNGKTLDQLGFGAPVTMDCFNQRLSQNISDRNVLMLSLYIQMAENGINHQISQQITVSELSKYGFQWSGAPERLPF